MDILIKIHVEPALNHYQWLPFYGISFLKVLASKKMTKVIIIECVPLLHPTKGYLLNFFGLIWFDKNCRLFLNYRADFQKNNNRASNKRLFQYTLCSMINISSEVLWFPQFLEIYQPLHLRSTFLPFQYLKASMVSTSYQGSMFFFAPVWKPVGNPTLVAVRMTVDEFLSCEVTTLLDGVFLGDWQMKDAFKNI